MFGQHLLRARSSEPAPPLLRAQSCRLELKFSLAAGRWSCSPHRPLSKHLLHLWLRRFGFSIDTDSKLWGNVAALTKRLCRNVVSLHLPGTGSVSHASAFQLLIFLRQFHVAGAGALLRVSWSAAHRMLTLIMFTPPSDEGLNHPQRSISHFH